MICAIIPSLSFPMPSIFFPLMDCEKKAVINMSSENVMLLCNQECVYEEDPNGEEKKGKSVINIFICYSLE